MSRKINPPIRILITGVAGFIGSHLAEAYLEQGYLVTGMDNFDPFYDRNIKESNLAGVMMNENFTFIEADIRDCEFFENFKSSRFDVVIHLAAKAGVLPSVKMPMEYIKTNIYGTYNIIEWMRISNTQNMIFASSSSVYGNTDKVPFKEDNNTNTPISPYAFTKKSCETMNYTYHHLYNLNIINLRLFTVYGERQRPDLAIYKFVKKIMNNEEITLYGDGSTSRDYTYIKDIISGFDKALDYILANKNVFEVLNIGNNKPISLNDLLEKLSQLLNHPLKIKFEDMKPGDVQSTFADVSKAYELIGYKPIMPIETGLRNFIDWMKSKN